MNWENQSKAECESGMDAALASEKTKMTPDEFRFNRDCWIVYDPVAKEATLSYIEHSKDHWHSDSEEDIEISRECAIELVAWLCDRFGFEEWFTVQKALKQKQPWDAQGTPAERVQIGGITLVETRAPGDAEAAVQRRIMEREVERGEAPCKHDDSSQSACSHPLCRGGFIEGEIGNGPMEQKCPDCGAEHPVPAELRDISKRWLTDTPS